MTKIRTGQITSNSEAWDTYTPTVTSGSGSFATVSATGKSKQIGKTVFFEVQITITSNGTAATSLDFTLPVTAAAIAGWCFVGREIASTGSALVGNILSGGTQASMRKYDNSYVGANGYVINISGTYEAA